MKVIIEVKNASDVQKIERFFGKDHVRVVKSPREKILDGIFSKFNVKLPAKYKFDREDIHAR